MNASRVRTDAVRNWVVRRRTKPEHLDSRRSATALASLRFPAAVANAFVLLVTLQVACRDADRPQEVDAQVEVAEPNKDDAAAPSRDALDSVDSDTVTDFDEVTGLADSDAEPPHDGETSTDTEVEADIGPSEPRTLEVPPRTHRPRAARAFGTRSISRRADVVTFRFEATDGSVVAYEIDLAHPDVQRGLLVVREAISGAIPLSEGGLAWRRTDHDVLSPRGFADVSRTTLSEVRFDEAAGHLELIYDEAYEGVFARKSYAFSLEGGVFRVRLRSDGTRTPWTGHYAGVATGPARGLRNARRIRMPYAGSIPIVRFEPLLAEPRVLSIFADWYQSSGAEISIEPANPTERGVTSDATTFHLFFAPGPVPAHDGLILAPIDETLNVVVTPRVLDALPEPAHPPSPYRRTLAGRLNVNFADQSPGAFGGIANVLEWLDRVGVDGLAGYLFAWQRFGLNLLDPAVSPPGIMGCDGALLAAHATPLAAPRAFPVEQGLHTIRRVLDPDHPSLHLCGRERLVPVFERLARRGHLFALYQDAGHLDPHGFEGQGYPTDIPFARPAWGPYGLRVPALNPRFTDTLSEQVVRAADGLPMPGWDSSQNLGGTSWAGSGHALHPISPSHRTTYYLDGLEEELGPSGLRPRAAYVDAADAEVPSWNQIDRIAGSPRAHTIAEALAAQQRALATLRRRVGGPLFGEGAYAGRAQWESFESGLWDGRARQMTPPDEIGAGIEPTFGEPIIPDFELFAVLPRASGHHGMGWESNFGKFGVDYGFPVDLCPSWRSSCDRSSIFLDPWFAHEVSFGHMAYAGLNGWVPNEYRTFEGVLREYALVGAIHEAFVSTKVTSVDYVDRAGLSRNLDEALGEPDWDFVHPRIHIRGESGLEVFVNHSLDPEPWTVALPPHSTRDFDRVSLPRHGFVAFDPAGLLVMSAYNPDPSAPSPRTRIEYAHVPHRFTMRCGRGVDQDVAGFPDADARAALSNAGPLLAHTVFRSEVRQTVVAVERGLGSRGADPWTSAVSDVLEFTEGSGSWASGILGPRRALLALEVSSEVDLLPAGAHTAVRAVGRYEGGASADLTTQVTWRTSDAEVLTVDASGGVWAERRGVALVDAHFTTPEGKTFTASPVTLKVASP